MQSKSALLQVTFGCLLLLLFGCQGSLGTFSSSVPSANQIVVYSSLPSEQASSYLADFTQAHPDIDVQLVLDSAEILSDRLITQPLNQRADVIWGLPMTIALQLEWLDLLQPYEPAELANLDAGFYDTHRPPHWVGTSTQILVFCVNPAKLAELSLPTPRTWQELLTPIYQDHIMLPDPTTSEAGFLILGAFLSIDNEADGWHFVEELNLQAKGYATDSSVACNAAAEGRAPIAVSFDNIATQLQAAGSPIEVVYPADVAGWEMDITALVRKETVSDAAKTFADWASSQHTLQLYAEHSEFVPAHTAAHEHSGTVPHDVHALNATLLNEDITWVSANRERILQTWRDQFASNIVAVSK